MGAQVCQPEDSSPPPSPDLCHVADMECPTRDARTRQRASDPLMGFFRKKRIRVKKQQEGSLSRFRPGILLGTSPSLFTPDHADTQSLSQLWRPISASAIRHDQIPFAIQMLELFQALLDPP